MKNEIVLQLSPLSFESGSKKKYIHFDGYYSNEQHYNSVLMFIRFYADGTVTSALPATVQNVIQISPNQLDKDNSKECTIRGKYTLAGNNINFFLVDKNGTANFVGEFQKNKLKLKSHSNINGKDSEETYDFYNH